MPTVTPYGNKAVSKKAQVADMFNSIAGRYDFLNHFLSLGIDILWRKRAIRMLKPTAPKQVLDIATGTGDFAIASRKLKPNSITGIDISEQMLEVGKKKIKDKGLEELIELRLGDSEDLEFEDDRFDAITVGFGVRNFENLEKGLSEMHRVLSPSGTVAILEFSRPKRFPIKQLYNFYFMKVLPAFGKLISKDARAYTYLPESVHAFPDGSDFIGIMEEVGYTSVSAKPVSFGIATIYTGKK